MSLSKAIDKLCFDHSIESVVEALADFAQRAVKNCEPIEREQWRAQAKYLRGFAFAFPTLDSRELGTVLAAIRHWQDSVNHDARPVICDSIATDGGNFDALNNAEIDELCERLNCG